MPHSLILNLLPESPIPPGFTSGKHLHALFLNLVNAVDTDLSAQLHANQGNKAFTLSPLQEGNRGTGYQGKSVRVSGYQGKDYPSTHPPTHPSTHPSSLSHSLIHWHHPHPIPPNTPCWWRISLLDDRLFSRLTHLWLNLNPDQPWHLGPADLHITSILGTPQSTQPWANACNYAQLYEQASDQERKLILQFCTPTAFRQGKYDSAMPTPERVFGSLLRRWNQYSTIEFDDDSLTCLHPSQFDICTAIATDPRNQFQHTGAKSHPANQFIGCIGTVTYQILGTRSPDIIKQLNALADFALYAGVGRKTTMGMGMCRRE